MGLSLGVFGVSPAAADPEDKFFKQAVHILCGFELTQDIVAEELDVKANRGQCQKALREAATEDGDA